MYIYNIEHCFSTHPSDFPSPSLGYAKNTIDISGWRIAGHFDVILGGIEF